MTARGGAAAPVVATAREALAAATDALGAAECETPRLDAELLIADALGVDRATLLTEPDLGVRPPAARAIAERVRRRVAREPVAYVLGVRGFRRLDLAVDSRVLVPRPETELLVEVASELVPGPGWVHDVGTGSGAVALALADERPDLRVTASDASEGAVAVARSNAERLGLDVVVTHAPGLPPPAGDGAAGGALDLVVANMPYVRESEWRGLAPEITRFEPRAALVAGEDGLEAVRALVRRVPSGTLLALEHAPDQAADVRSLLRGTQTHPDLAGRDRVTVGRRP